MIEPKDPPDSHRPGGRGWQERWGAALLMAAAPFLLMFLLILVDRLLSR
jgi:hypothetical protein